MLFCLRNGAVLSGAAFISLLAPTFAIAQSGAILYQQAALSGDYGGYFSCPLNKGNRFLAADNFTLGATQSIGEVTWIGGAIIRNSNLINSADYHNPANDFSAFSINFYSSAGGPNSQPGSLLFSKTFDISQTKQTAAGPRYFTHDVALVSPFVAKAGVEYWLSVQALARDPASTTNNVYLWGFGATGDSRERSDNLDTATLWDYQNAVNLGFSLRQSSVPEPSAPFAAFASLSCGALFLRRRQKWHH